MTSVEIITHSKLKLLICCCYRPPNAEKIWLDKFNSILADLSSRHDNIIICGDFNFPKVNWQSPAKTFGADEISFTEQLNDFYLTQLNTLATRGVNILDLDISSVPNQINNITLLNPENSGLFTDHSVIIFDLKTSVRQGRTFQKFLGVCQIFWDRLSWLSFLIIIIIIKSLFKLSIIVSADNTMTAGINTSAEILFSSYPPARSIIFSKNC